MKAMNDTQKTLLHDFAKSNKYSHSKLESFVGDLFAAFPKSAHLGRKMNPQTLEVVKAVEAVAQEGSYQNFTIKQLSQIVKSTPPTVTNILKKMASEGKANIVGKGEKVVGVRGKVPAVWAFKQASQGEVA